MRILNSRFSLLHSVPSAFDNPGSSLRHGFFDTVCFFNALGVVANLHNSSLEQERYAEPTGIH